LASRKEFEKALNEELAKVGYENYIPCLISEIRVYRELDIKGRKFIISGKFDLLDMFTRTLYDYKEMSVSKYQFNDWHKFEIQSNVYLWLMRNPMILDSYTSFQKELMKILKTITVDSIKLAIKLKDWKSQSVGRSRDYPEKGFQQIEIEKWDDMRTTDLLTFHIERLYQYENVNPLEIPICEDIATWRKDSTFPVFKKNKDGKIAEAPRAMPGTASFTAKDQAIEFISTHKDKELLYCEERPSNRLYCHEYCNMSAIGLCKIHELEKQEKLENA
jgi:hypothetical protein